MEFLKKLTERVIKAVGSRAEGYILDRRRQVFQRLNVESWVSVHGLELAGAGSRSSIEATLEDLEQEGFVESRFEGGETTIRRGSIKVFRRTKLGQFWFERNKSV